MALVQESERADAVGPALARLLARLTGDGLQQVSNQPPADRLGQWMAWTDAIALSAVLDRPAPVVRAGAALNAAQACQQLRRELTDAVMGDALLSATVRRDAARSGGRRAAPPPEPDYETYRERYVLLQRTMASRITELRQRLRGTLAAKGDDRARLAAADAVMESITQGRESSALDAIPNLLEKRFLHVGQSAGSESSDSWRAVFCQDMRSVLLAELDVRLLPVEGLAEALNEH